ncbi:hypothetical protein T265_00827 [Opisthorchis viverrini]|uniref:BTB domain-containing protein n=1 Tax=Opisthorchis viverrini TaxID=6198 RepID=A0A075A4X2_OPIVI|nr:hypothetical protein T265_00827 [Opisthorchis viverrini]KER33337.1 hypothetical protein T265_00827 [Opisthorchis viverrini]
MAEFQKEHVRAVSRNFVELLQHDQFLDVTVTLHGFELKSNRLLLSASSGYFRSLFDFYENQSSGTAHYDISSEYLTVKGFQFIIRFLHSLGQDWEVIPAEDYELIYAAASFLQVHSLQCLLSDLIVHSLTPSSVLDALRLASVFDDRHLHTQSMMLLLNKFHLIDVFSEEFLQLSEDRIRAIFLSDQVNVPSESFMVEALLSWVSFDVEERMDFFRQMFTRLIRLSLVKAADLKAIATDTRFAKASGAIDLLLQAYRSLSGIPTTPELDVTLATTGLQTTSARIGTAFRIYAIGGLEDLGVQVALSVDEYRTPPFYSFDTALLQSKPHVNPGEPCRVYHAVASSLSWIYITGGESEDGEIIDHCSKYSLTEKKWFPMASLDAPRSHHSLVSVETFLYGFGGYRMDWSTGYTLPTDSIFVYDAIFNRWTQSVHKLPFVAVDMGAVLLPSKRMIMLAGGLQEHGDEMRPSNNVILYDPAEDGNACFITLPNLPLPLTGVALAYDEISDHVFACGGKSDPAHATQPGFVRGDISGHVLQFSFDTHCWSTVAALDCPRYHATALIHDSKLFILGGITEDDTAEFIGRLLYDELKSLSESTDQSSSHNLAEEAPDLLTVRDPGFILHHLFSPNYRRPDLLYHPYRPCHFIEAVSILRQTEASGDPTTSSILDPTPAPRLKRCRFPVEVYDTQQPWFGRCLAQYCIAPDLP